MKDETEFTIYKNHIIYVYIYIPHIYTRMKDMEL